ncbi:MAG: hypothetical protein VX642_13380 [Bdellovibrionota bacterium]|nr:hypothetical protein [Bdellovibrionota bacterium]
MKKLFLLIFLFLNACGVKNDPIPPGVQAEIGRGRPQPKAWLLENNDSVDPTSLEVLDYLEVKKEDKKKK